LLRLLDLIDWPGAVLIACARPWCSA